jgi:hypothetical protein
VLCVDRWCANGIVSGDIKLKRECEIWNPLRSRRGNRGFENGKRMRIFRLILESLVILRKTNALNLICHYGEELRLYSILMMLGVTAGQKCQQDAHHQKILYRSLDHIIYRCRKIGLFSSNEDIIIALQTTRPESNFSVLVKCSL